MSERCVACLVFALALVSAAPVQATVTLAGVDGAMRENVLAFMSLDDEPCDAPDWRVRQEFESGPRAIRTALEAFGYYEASVTSSLESDESCWVADFNVVPGAPVRLRSLDLTLGPDARLDPVFVAAINGFELGVGVALDHGAYERLKRRLLDIARERGYAQAAFSEARIDVYPAEHAADIVMHFESGPRYRFGDIVFIQEVLNDDLVRSYLNFKPGDPYDNRRLSGLYVALTDSGYFRNIDIRALPPVEAEQVIPIEVSLTAGTRRIVTYGAGYSTDVGPRLRIGRTDRRRNLAGHQLGVNAQLSPVISEVAWNYRFPYGDPRTEWVSFAAGVKREHTDAVYSKSGELSARRIIMRPRQWTLTQSLEFIAEDFEVAEQVGTSRVLMPGLSWTKTVADNAIRPSSGSRRDLALRAASESLGSDATFFQTTASGKRIWSLPNGGRFLLRAEIGVTLKDQLQDLPPSVRFFAGGDQSVRGYDFKSLGPQDASGQVVGGSRLLVGSFEFEQPFAERWSGALFVDSGNAFEGSDFKAKTGAGFGVRWLSPLGPVRVDIGYPLDVEDRSPRLHISLGPDL
jgi:translocation and assembly module TamA